VWSTTNLRPFVLRYEASYLRTKGLRYEAWEAQASETGEKIHVGQAKIALSCIQNPLKREQQQNGDDKVENPTIFVFFLLFSNEETKTYVTGPRAEMSNLDLQHTHELVPTRSSRP
jgi:hypothetical protein